MKSTQWIALSTLALSFIIQAGTAHADEPAIPLASDLPPGHHLTATPTTPVTDQDWTLQCWAVSSTARFDIDASDQVGFTLKLSPKYTVYTKTREEVVGKILAKSFDVYQGELCENCKPEPIYYEQGGIYADAVETAKLYGVVPESAYPGFPHHDEALFRALNHLIDRYAHEKSSVDFSSPALKPKLEREVSEILDTYLGKPPTRFVFEDKTYTPTEFAQAVLPRLQANQALELNYAPGAKASAAPVQAFDGANYPSLTTGDQAKLFRVLEASLRAGEPVLIQYKVIDEDHTQGHGTIGFAVHGLATPDYAHLDWNSENILDHYVLAIGAEWDESGHIVRLLVKNTWDVGPEAGYGFHWMQADYFPLIESVELRPEFAAGLGTLR